MSKFKAGDKVRVRDGGGCGTFLIEGREFTVGRTDGQCIWLPDGPEGPWEVSRFELVEAAPSNPSPIRKVTRTEIVPGTYGDVDLEDDGPLGIFIRYSEYASAPGLRNAARIFNEIADALDEQSREAL